VQEPVWYNGCLGFVISQFKMRPMRLFRSQSVAEQKQEDRVWREPFVQNAVANVRLEGLEPSPKALEIWQRYIEGEISVEQAGELIRALPTGF
jgi:Antitoxin VbhA